MKLKDKVALVTGSTSGLGKGIALAFVREGAKVVINGRNQEKIDETLNEIIPIGGEALGVKADISSSKQVREMFSKILESFGTLDILVNNAAVYRLDEAAMRDRTNHLDLITTPIHRRSLEVTKNMSDEEWKRVFEVNVNGLFYCTREALKIMEEKKYGKIINISSLAGVSVMSSHSPNYSASKGAVVAFTKSVAHEVAGVGININCIAPGYIETPPVIDLLSKKWDAERSSRFLQLIPLGRIGKIEEYTSIAVFLASDESSYIVGQVIGVNGGIVI